MPWTQMAIAPWCGVDFYSGETLSLVDIFEIGLWNMEEACFQTRQNIYGDRK